MCASAFLLKHVTMKEIWKPIKGFSRYEASNTGFLRSLNYKNSGKVKILKPALTEDGYLKTMLLGDNKKYRNITVHICVAKAWLIKKTNNLQIDHRNNIKTDNRITNLEYVTLQENVRRATANGLQKPRKGSLHGASKLKEKDVLDIINHVKNHAKFTRFKKPYGYGRKQLANKYNVTEGHIKEIVNGKKNRKPWDHILKDKREWQ